MSKGAASQNMALPPWMLLGALRGGPQGIESLLEMLTGQGPYSAGKGMQQKRDWQKQDAQSTPDQFGWFDWLKENYRQPDDLDRNWDDPVADYSNVAPDRREVASSLGYKPVGLKSYQNHPLTMEQYGQVPASQIRQTLEQAGWNESMGYGPQENLSTDMNKLLYSIKPEFNKERLPVPKKDPRLSSVYDPFAGMQSATARDAYVNDTLGGGFYGGVIPEKDDYTPQLVYNIRRGGTPDPHFPVASLDASGDSDFYTGWASNQAQQFGSLPYEAFGQQVNDVNNPGFGPAAGSMTKNTAPRTWNGGSTSPWPSSGNGKPVDWGNNGWGQNQNNQNQSNQEGSWTTGWTTNQNQGQKQVGMGFGASPWENPWNMK